MGTARSRYQRLEVADGSEKGGATSLGVLPAFASLEAKGRKEAG
jgi:hypothetical protein